MLEHACFDSLHVYSRFIMHCDEWCFTSFFAIFVHSAKWGSVDRNPHGD
jgi:hypothetical protein